MYFRLCRATALVAVLGCNSMTTAAQTSTPAGTQAGEDPVVARVNGAEINRSDLISAQQALPKQYRQVPLKSIFQPLLRQMINNRLIVRAARAQGLHDDPGVKRQVADMLTNNLDRVKFVFFRDQLLGLEPFDINKE